MDRQTLAVGSAAARHGQRHCVIACIVVGMRWILRTAVRRAIAKVPVPGRDTATGLIGELHRQGRVARGWAGVEIRRGRWRRNRRDVDRHALAVGPAAACYRQGHRKLPFAVIRIRRVLRAAVR